jgi:hypothetical protein
MGLILILVTLLVVPLGIAHAQGVTPTPTHPPVSVSGTPEATPPAAEIQSPAPGRALQGSVSIVGNSQIPGFVTFELSFSYAGDSTGTWFLIQESSQPVANGLLAQWDTSAITDGIYHLRLVVTLQGGSQTQAVVTGLRVRNYTPIETETPTPVTPTVTLVPGNTPVPTSTATPPVKPTPTPLATNPAEITRSDVISSMGKGMLAVLGMFALMGVFALLKRLAEKG